MNELQTVVVLCALLAPLTVPAQQPRSDFAQVVEHRKELMRSMALNGRRIQMMVYGLEPYKAADAKRDAKDLVRLSNEAFDLYPSGSVGNASQAKPELWEQIETFRQHTTAFKQSVADLAVAAEKEDLDGLRATFGKMVPACEACHRAFRRE